MDPGPAFAQSFSRLSTLAVLLVPLLLIAAGADLLGDRTIERIATTLFINVALVVGLQIFMGNSGILSFAHIGFMGIGAYASVLFSMAPRVKAFALPDLYPFLADIQLPFLAAVFIGAAVAGLIAALISYPLMRLSDAAAVITSFALLVVIHNVLVHWKTVTNGPQTLFGVTRHTDLWTSALCGVAFVVLAYWFKESRFGLQLRASRNDRTAAATSGVDIVVVRWIGFVLSAFVAGFAGALWAHFITSFSPTAFYLKETFVILAMLVIGGPGSVSGAVVGTLVVTAVFETLRGAENAINIQKLFANPVVGLTEIVLAVAMIGILILRPSGIMGGRELGWPTGARLGTARSAAAGRAR
ncbi:MAG: branched-chain amino acid ABC transporter permease [Kiloniellaceae bacterium]